MWVRPHIPVDTIGWISLMHAALAVPYKSIVIPQHLRLKSLATKQNVSFSSFNVEHEITKESAVLLLVAPTQTPRGLDMCIPLTMRSSHMRAHKGQMALPGGRCDHGESIDDAAKRETFEEIGIPSTAYTVVGRLRRIWSYPSKSWVTPVVAIAHDSVVPRINSPQEVDSLHFLHLRSLLEFSGATHVRLERYFSPRSGGPISMPCFYASDTMTKPLDVVVGDTAAAAAAAACTPGAEVLIDASQCSGTLTWGLTGFIICELVTRLFIALAEKAQVLATDNAGDALHLAIPHSCFVVRDPDINDDKRQLLLKEFAKRESTDANDGGGAVQHEVTQGFGSSKL